MNTLHYLRDNFSMLLILGVVAQLVLPLTAQALEWVPTDEAIKKMPTKLESRIQCYWRKTGNVIMR